MILPIDLPETLRPVEAARVLGVGDTTLKRGRKRGRIPCERTAGGHRRFRRADVEAFAARYERRGAARRASALNGSAATLASARRPGEPSEPDRDDVRSLGPARAQPRLGRGGRPALCGAADRGRRADGREGRSRARASTRSRARSRPRSSGSRTRCRPAQRADRCCYACIPGERHTLGLSLIETAVRERGMSVAVPGRGRATSDIVKAVRRGPARRRRSLGVQGSPRPAAEFLAREGGGAGLLPRSERACSSRRGKLAAARRGVPGPDGDGADLAPSAGPRATGLTARPARGADGRDRTAAEELRVAIHGRERLVGSALAPALVARGHERSR